MHVIKCIILVVAMFFFSLVGYSQDCNWTICLYDSYGDGWDWADVEVIVNGTSLGYAWLDGSDGYGPVCYNIPLSDGNTLDIIYTAGWWSYENFYALYDGDGNLYYVSNAPPDDYQTVVTCPTPVPIELLSFDYDCESSTLNWITSSETNNDYFTIEKSYDTKKWEVVDKIFGHGNSNTEKFYETNITENEAYYRLCQHDYDGTTVCYKVIYVDCESENSFEVYPVPVNRNEYLNICCGKIKSLYVIDLLGQEIQYERSDNAIRIPISGTYIVIINNTEIFKIIVH